MKISYLICVCLLVAGQLKCFADPVPEAGKKIFTIRCAACHNINKDMTGPALAGVDQRRSIDWIISFIHSPQKMIKSGDAYATALFNRFNNITMPDHADLKEDDIKSLVSYIKSESNQVSIEKPPFSRPGKRRPAYEPLSITGDYGFFISFLAFIAILTGVMLVAVDVKAIQRNRLKNKEGEGSNLQ